MAGAPVRPHPTPAQGVVSLTAHPRAIRWVGHYDFITIQQWCLTYPDLHPLSNHVPKGHDVKCTEGFYRSHVEREVRLEQKEKKATSSTPQAFSLPSRPMTAVRAEEDDEDEEEALDEEQYRRLEALSLSDDISLDQLTEEEKKAFEKAVLDGELGRLVEVGDEKMKIMNNDNGGTDDDDKNDDNDNNDDDYDDDDGGGGGGGDGSGSGSGGEKE